MQHCTLLPCAGRGTPRCPRSGTVKPELSVSPLGRTLSRSCRWRDKYGYVRKDTERAAPQRGCEVAKLALCGEDVKTAAVPPDEVPLPGSGCVNGCVLGQTGKFVQSQNTACWGRYLETDDYRQVRTVTDARGSVSALAELRQNKTTPLFLKRERGRGGKRKTSFLVKRSFPLPQEPSTLIGNSAYFYF